MVLLTVIRDGRMNERSRNLRMDEYLQARIAIAEMRLGLYRLAVAHYPHETPEELFVLQVLLAFGRPMSASAIARQAALFKISRVTVRRRLTKLIQKGIVEQHGRLFSCVTPKLFSPSDLRTAHMLIRRAHLKLSKFDIIRQE